MAGFRILNDVFGVQEKSPDDIPTEIIAAGGEYIISPATVDRISGGNVDIGHKELDDFVKQYREQTIRTLQSLPGPKRD